MNLITPLLIGLSSMAILLSCRKERELPTEPSPLDKYNGNFHCDYVREYGEFSEVHHKYDRVIEITGVNDTLTVNGISFPIANTDQFHFHVPIDGDTQAGWKSISFSLDFDSIYIDNFWPGEWNSSSSWNVASGRRTNLPLTTHFHPLNDELQGVYDLEITLLDSEQGIDTTYFDSLFASFEDSIFVEGIISRGTWNFHSYEDFCIQPCEGLGTYRRTALIGNDSLYLEYHSIFGFEPNVDTTYSKVCGTRQ